MLNTQEPSAHICVMDPMLNAATYIIVTLVKSD